MVKKYRVEFLSEAVSDLRKIDKIIAQRILNKIKWLSENFEDVVPEILTGDFKGMYKLRVGNWRVIYGVDKEKRIIRVFMVGHRKDIYKG